MTPVGVVLPGGGGAVRMVVVGGTGRLGRRVVERLVERGITAVVVGRSATEAPGAPDDAGDPGHTGGGAALADAGCGCATAGRKG